MSYKKAKKRIDEIINTRGKNLILSEMDLKELPEEIAELTWLENLFMSFNSIVNINILSSLNNLKKLDLRGNQIQNIEALSNLTNLTYLDLDNNQISNISPLANKHKLEILFVSYNNINSIEGVEKLSNLKELDLSHNNIISLGQLENLRQLEKLRITDNSLSDINPLKSLVNIEYLYLHNNKIENLTPLEGIPKLRRLTIGNNRIEDISPIIIQIKNNKLDIRNVNDKNENPENNPLKIPPPEIVSRGNNSIIRYFNELHIQGSEKLYEAKLLIVGEGGVGKTSLANKLIDDENPLPKEDETTFGIDIHKISFMKTEDESDFYLNIWDFGGQEIYHSTHQFFLTHRSLYVLVDDTRKDDKNVHDSSFSYWLQVIQLLGGDSPLLIIQNEKGDRSKAIDLKSMQAKFGFIKECKTTNLLTNRGLKDIKLAIKYWLSQLSHVGEVLPIQWIKIRNKIEELTKIKDYISIDEYFEVCEKNKIPEEERALNLSKYLHDLGVFLHFQDDIILGNIVILKNSWATDAVYYILDDEQIKKKGGFFNGDDLSRLWCEKKYKRNHVVLLSLMEKFEISYKLNDREKPSWLAPQLLPIIEPEINWNDENNLIIKYQYDFMPKGILSRLIVRLNRYAKNAKFAWRNGILISRKSTDALIRETFAGREIVVQCSGVLSREFMTIIAEEIDDLNSSFKNIKVHKLIPCNCSICKQSFKPHFYNYEKLLNRLQRSKSTVECDQSFNDVSVDWLINNVFATIDRKKYEDMQIFISYSHKDTEFKDNLLNHLSGLKLTNKVKTWDDQNVKPGDRWDEKIRDNMTTSDIILFLVSSDFLSSKYIWEKEIPFALEKEERQETIVIPIFLRPCDFQDIEFMKRQGLPRRPVTTYKNHDEAYTEISKGIRKRISSLKRY